MYTLIAEAAEQATAVDADFSTISAGGWIACVLAVIVSYFIGNISPAILIGKAHGIDIKKEGSGNAGTTNVLRVLGKKAAVGTLAIDILKGVVAIWLGRIVGLFVFGAIASDLLVMACGLAVFCGHIWPMAFGFKGGKGVATAFGVLVAFQPLLGITALLIVLVSVAITRKVSMGSIVGAATLPLIAYFLFPLSYYNRCYLIWAIIMALIVILKHRTNIVRLIHGEESNISFKKTEMK